MKKFLKIFVLTGLLAGSSMLPMGSSNAVKAENMVLAMELDFLTSGEDISYELLQNIFRKAAPDFNMSDLELMAYYNQGMVDISYITGPPSGYLVSLDGIDIFVLESTL